MYSRGRTSFPCVSSWPRVLVHEKGTEGWIANRSIGLSRKRNFGDHAQSKDAKDAGLCGPPSMNGGLIGGPPLPVLFP